MAEMRSPFVYVAGYDNREGVDEGIQEMRRQMSVSRMLVEEASEKLRSSFSRPGSAAVPLAPPADAVGLDEEGLPSSQPKDMAEVLDVQTGILARELAAKEALLRELGAEREVLRSAQSARLSSGQATPPTAQSLSEEKRLKEVREIGSWRVQGQPCWYFIQYWYHTWGARPALFEPAAVFLYRTPQMEIWPM